MTETTPTEPAVEPAQEAEPTNGTPPATGEGTEPTPEPQGEAIPKARLDAEITKRREVEKALAKYRDAEQKAADEKAKAAGDIETAQKERDTYKDQAKALGEYVETRLAEVLEGMDEADKAVIDALGDSVPLTVKLATADKLLARKGSGEPTPKPAVGSGGGPAELGAQSLIPSTVTSAADYGVWINSLTTSRDPEERALLTDPQKAAMVRTEARKKGFG